MKFHILLFAAIIVASLAILACGWLAKRKHGKNLAAAFIALIAFVLSLPAALIRRAKFGNQMQFMANSEIGAGTHEDTVTKFTAVAIATRHLIYKIDSTDATGKRVVVCGSGDRALFTVPDEVSTTDLANRSPAPVECIMLGGTNKSVRMVANAALTPGTVVYPVTGGMVDSYANIGSGSNYPAGVVINSGATAQGQVIEVISTIEYQVATA